MHEEFEFYCRLYVHSEKDIVELRESVVEILNGVRELSSIETNVMHLKLVKWEGFNAEKIKDEEGFLYYRYTAEVNPIHEIYVDRREVDQVEYCDSVCGLIKRLRERGALVVAACDFDDLVVEKTGWNWSESTPVHP